MKIKFITEYNFENEKVKKLLTPKPLAKILPDWYIKTNAHFTPREPNFLSSIMSKTIKKCMPVYDYMSCGYCIPAWEDYLIQKDENGVIEYRSKAFDDCNHKHTAHQYTEFAKTNIFNEYYGERNLLDIDVLSVPKLLNIWRIKTPKNYSCLFMRPFYHEQKINILSGIVDTDVYDNCINFPFFINLKKNEEYLVKLGTPMIYVFPFKRDDWKCEVEFNKPESAIDIQLSLSNFYKKFVRTKKNYE